MAVKSNLVIDQGSTFSATLTVTDVNNDPIDLTNYTASAKLRKWYTSNSSVSFSTSSGNSSGLITLSLNYVTTGSLDSGRYVYDVELTDTVANSVYRVIEGIATVTPQVTR